MKRLLLGAGVIVLVGSGWAFGRYGSDLRPTLNTAVLSTTTAIGRALGGPRVAVPSSAPTPEAAPILQPRTSVPRPTVAPRRPAEESEDHTVAATAGPSEPTLTVPNGGDEPVRAREILVAPVEVYGANDTDILAPKLSSLRELTVLPEGFPDNGVRVLEIVVNEAGQVDSASVPGRPRTLGEYMVTVNGLSIAKAWSFQPATRQGVAVKYRLRVLLADTLRRSSTL